MRQAGEVLRGRETDDGRIALRITVEHLDAAIVVHVVGEVDLSTVTRLEESITSALDEQPAVLVVDLTGVEFMGSCGLAALWDAKKRAGEDIRLCVATSHRATLRPIELTGLTDVLEPHPTVEDALAGG